jgi:hypothetical protein
MVCRVLVKDACLGFASGTVIGVACSKTASTGFGPIIRAPAIAATPAARRRTSGVAGVTDKPTVPVNTADNNDGNKADAIANVAKIAGLPYKPPSHPHRAQKWRRVCHGQILQLCRRSRSQPQTQRARVGACTKIRVFLAIARVIGQAATSFSCPTPVRRINVIASRNAVRPCDASANASCVGTGGVAAAASHGRCERVPVPIDPPKRRPVCSSPPSAG